MFNACLIVPSVFGLVILLMDRSCATCPVLHSRLRRWNEGQDKLHSFLEHLNLVTLLQTSQQQSALTQLDLRNSVLESSSMRL